MNVAVVTPWISHPELLAGWLRATTGAAERIVVDNGGAPAAELADAGVRVIKPAAPLGFAASNNLAARFATAPIVAFLNNDIDGDGQWLEHAGEAVEDDALYGPSIATQTLLGIDVPYVEGWCVAATTETWRHLGWWDQDAFPFPYWEDVDLSVRAVRAGVALRFAPWRLKHLGGVSTGSVPGAWDGFAHQRSVVEGRLREFVPA